MPLSSAQLTVGMNVRVKDKSGNYHTAIVENKDGDGDVFVRFQDHSAIGKTFVDWAGSDVEITSIDRPALLCPRRGQIEEATLSASVITCSSDVELGQTILVQAVNGRRYGAEVVERFVASLRGPVLRVRLSQEAHGVTFQDLGGEGDTFTPTNMSRPYTFLYSSGLLFKSEVATSEGTAITNASQILRDEVIVIKAKNGTMHRAKVIDRANEVGSTAKVKVQFLDQPAVGTAFVNTSGPDSSFLPTSIGNTYVFRYDSEVLFKEVTPMTIQYEVLTVENATVGMTVYVKNTNGDYVQGVLEHCMRDSNPFSVHPSEAGTYIKDARDGESVSLRNDTAWFYRGAVYVAKPAADLSTATVEQLRARLAELEAQKAAETAKAAEESRKAREESSINLTPAAPSRVTKLTGEVYIKIDLGSEGLETDSDGDIPVDRLISLMQRRQRYVARRNVLVRRPR